MNLEVKEYLPFIIPFIIIEVILLAVALIHIFTHERYKCGNRLIWVLVVILGSSCLIGPILYFVIGRSEEY
ncbi:MAG: PLD nuclease N-terminal domain-containing protein [Lachnospiraceae bacterium]|nr:PLD nuclease N-terminal domain-containing protein [Lachnospiraceae bacterium]